MAINKNKIKLNRYIPKVSDSWETFQEKQVKYWTDRAERNYIAGEKEALQVAKEIQANYKKCIKEIEEKINAFYGKYAKQNGITLEEVKKLLNKSELKSFKEYLTECIEFKKQNNIPTKEYELLKLKTKVTRWDELKTEIQFELDKLTKTSEEKIGALLYNNYEDGYYKTIFNSQQFIGHTTSFNGLNKPTIGKAINTKYLGDNYNTLIWKNQSKLMTTLNQEIPRGLTLGYNPRKLASQTVKRINTNYNNIVRLIRTEYSRILNDATLMGYKASGISQYEILATLEQKDRTCGYCQELDYRNSGKAINIDEAETGVNYPPFHPNCRCTTIAHFEKDEIDEMTDEELSNIGYITYDDWKNGLVELDNGKVIYHWEKGLKLEN